MNAKEEYHAAYAAMEKAGAIAVEAGERAQKAQEDGSEQEFEEAKQEFEEVYKIYYDAVELANTTRAAAWQSVFDSITSSWKQDLPFGS